MTIRLTMATATALAALLPSAWAQTDVCFYEKDRFTIKYELTGMEAGTITEHVKDCGRTRVEIKETTVEAFGIKQTTSQRTIYDGPQIITVDTKTGQTTITQNPIWDNMVEAMKGRGETGVEFGTRMLKGLGGTPTGQSGKFAGHACDYWTVSSLNSEVCVVSWGATLHATTRMMGMTAERKAVEVVLGEGGPASAYSYDSNAAQQVPNLGDIMKRMRGQ